MAATADLLRRRVDGSFAVDPWGLDVELVELLAPAARMRWDIDVEGVLDLPDGPFAVVISRRLGLSEPWVVAEAIRRMREEVRLAREQAQLFVSQNRGGML